jgi:enhancing lycopene biosynthesis protein 2
VRLQDFDFHITMALRNLAQVRRFMSKYCASLSTSASAVPLPKIAVVLSGCGVYDGSEAAETTSMLIHLSKAKVPVAVFAPNKQQAHVINHVNGEPMENELRDVMEEGARFVRGNVNDLSLLSANIFDGVLFPGGFGAAKNLCTYAIDGKNMKVDEIVKRVILDFHDNGRPIGMCCIASVLAAKLIPGCEVTLGQEANTDGKWPHNSAVQAVKEMGAVHVNKEANEVHVDNKNKLVTTPALLCDTDLHEVFTGIGRMIDQVIELATHNIATENLQPDLI